MTQNIIKQQYSQYLGANPYKGFVPFFGFYKLEHSMEFVYYPLNKILVSDKTYDFTDLDKIIASIFERKKNVILRIYMDYPKKETGIPDFFFKYINQIPYNEFGGGIETDYNDKHLIRYLIKFIKVFSKHYKNDMRIAFLECGLLGHWGEWHTYPQNEFMANVKNQVRIIKRFNLYFKKIPILTRYPSIKSLKKYKIGFHDDSFCYSTLPTNNENFLDLMKLSKLENQFLFAPIGGEVRPEEQQKLNTNGYSKEDYYECVKQTKCSWLVNQGAFLKNVNASIVKKMSASLGYDFYVYDVKQSKRLITFSLKNIGVAPLYHDFDLFVLYYKDNNVFKKIKLRNLRLLKVDYEYHFKIPFIESSKIVLIAQNKALQQIVFSNKFRDKHNQTILYG